MKYFQGKEKRKKKETLANEVDGLFIFALYFLSLSLTPLDGLSSLWLFPSQIVHHRVIFLFFFTTTTVFLFRLAFLEKRLRS
jgi:hypothetical protein